MTEQAVQQPIIVQPAETGRNWEARKKWETSLPGIRLSGYPEGLGQALIKLGMVPGYKGIDIPGSLDDLAEALDSDENILLRKNFVGQYVPARWYEYIQDRKDIVTGVLGDYFLGPLLNIAGYFLAGYSSENEKEAEIFIQQVRRKYPIDPEWYLDFYLSQIPKKPKTSQMIFYKLRKNETGEFGREPDFMMEGNYDIPNWPNPSGVYEMGKVFLESRVETRHNFRQPRPD